VTALSDPDKPEKISTALARENIVSAAAGVSYYPKIKSEVNSKNSGLFRQSERINQKSSFSKTVRMPGQVRNDGLGWG